MGKLGLAMLIKTSLGIFSVPFLIIDVSIFRKLRIFVLYRRQIFRDWYFRLELTLSAIPLFFNMIRTL